MGTWPDNRIQDLFGINLPIIQAPMAGPVFSEMMSAVSVAGGLGSLPCALLSPEQIQSEFQLIRQQTTKPVNLNFFCHKPPTFDPERETSWKKRLARYYLALGLDPNTPVPTANRAPFDAALCDLVITLKPEVVSFHFGLPDHTLVARIKAMGAKIISSATSVDEARWLEDHGCDAIIAQGVEAGGHRGLFLSDDVTSQVGTMALVPQVVDAVSVTVIAAGGIADARGIVAAFALGASAVQIGTAFLFCPEARLSPVHRQALQQAKDNNTVLTNVFTGRPARGLLNQIVREVGPLSELAPAFPLAGGALAPLRSAAESAGSVDFTPVWSGQAARLSRSMPAGELIHHLAQETLSKLSFGQA